MALAYLVSSTMYPTLLFSVMHLQVGSAWGMGGDMGGGMGGDMGGAMGGDMEVGGHFELRKPSSPLASRPHAPSGVVCVGMVISTGGQGSGYDQGL